MFMQPSEWRKSFENKTDSELAAMQVPPDLPLWYANMWRRDRDEALALSRSSQPATGAQEHEEDEDDEIESDASEKDENRGRTPLAEKLEAALSILENDGLPPPRPTADEPLRMFEIPKGNVADLLEQQIGMCAALIGTITDHVAHDPSDPSRYHLMDRVSAMLSSSAGAARVVGQLRGIAAETKQTFITQKEGKGAGGVP